MVVGSGTKALGGSDRDLWGYVATNDVPLANSVMDLIAMRGGILDWRRAAVAVDGLDAADAAHARRCDTAGQVAAFLASHPRVSEVFHPSLASHPDAAAVRRIYRRHGSLLSFRVAGADEAFTRHVADVLAMTVVVRYALSFDGLATKVNHHRTVSEYFTTPALVARNGFDRLIRLGIGLEDANDLIAALNWALHHADRVSADEVAAWQRTRAASLGLGLSAGEDTA
ncbi:MAG: PLP-dependent transferase [Vicinamibacterales bacterium]